MVKWVLGAVAVVVVSVALWAFEPWRLWTSSTLDEAVPGATGEDVSVRDVADVPTSTPTSASTSTSTEPAPVTPAESRLRIVAEGAFEDAEHETSGTAFVVETAGGDRYLRVEGLATSDGPDLHVALSDAPSGGSWGSYDDGRYVELGDLKATHGNHNYAIPDDVDLDDLTTAVIWCDRFDVAFGTAPLAA
ncbi:DM13 domain-containing protein [Nocardioides sp.]|uniref:DM13 domain-containing protein n=1 Tax=Nocardioides sp. TaxID=35761 RepID=UPI00271A6881|nr:DM13 domain-containing protein [Nocardioides sp.]MDO9455743.1 DM13 domain-containing protein [Nocardioides sp.]